MKPLRRLHLYLGCLFAPMILFFALSGVWQTLGWHQPGDGPRSSQGLALASTLHTGRGLKSQPSTLSSPVLRWVSVAMAAALVATILLGIVMAFRFGQRGAAIIALGAGLAIPLLLVLLQYYD